MKTKAVLAAVLIVCLTGTMLFPAAAVSEGPLRPLCFVHAAGLAKNEKNAPVLTAPKGGSPEIGRLSGEDTCTVVGEEGKYKRVIYEGETGYILSEKIRVTAREAEALPEALCGGIALADPIPPLNSLYLSLEGTLSCGRPFDTLFAYIWDERQLKVNRAYLKPLEKSAESLELSSLKSFLPIGDVPGGRKTLVLEAAYEGEMFVVFRTPLYIRGAAEDVRHITAQCTENAALLDEKISTAWVPTQRSSALPVSFPADGSAVLMTLEWKVIPDRFTVELYGGDGALLSEETRRSGRYQDSVAIPENARRALIRPEGTDAALGQLRVYDGTYSRHAVQEWQELPEKTDILFVSAHQDDELLFFGGAIPYYTHREGVNAAVLYMADCGRTRCREALDGLWTAGVRIYPFFCGLTDEFTMNPDLALSRWEKAGAQEMLVSAIRRCKPDVVVCQDLNGEYGHGQHRATSLMTTRAVTLAADATYDAPSAEAYGVWQVKKLYVHLYEQDEIIMDWSGMKLDDTGVITALFLATEAYDKHRSQQASFSMHHHGVLYDNTRFGLYFTDVGPDEAKNGFLEHITE